jgi:hypothetical protein
MNGSCPSPVVTALLGVLTAAGAVVMCAGIGLALYANSPRNRNGDDLADIGVAEGIVVAIAGGLLTLGFVVELVVRRRR